MKRVLLVAALVWCAGCGGPEPDKPIAEAPPSSGPAEKQKLPSLDAAVSKLKTDIKDAADTAKTQIAQNAEAEFDRISKQLQEVADDFGKNSGQLQGEAKERYEKMRIEFENKKANFEEKFKEFKDGSTGAKRELLKGLYDALAEMKGALDRAAEAFRQGAAAPSESEPY